MLTNAQLEVRRQGVSASELAAVCGFSPWSTPQDVWARKLDLMHGPEQTKAMARGNHLEAGILAWTASEERLLVDCVQRTVICPSNPLIIATADGIAYPANGQGSGTIAGYMGTDQPIAVVEVKSPGPRTSKDWIDPATRSDGIPMYNLTQVVGQMLANDLDMAIVGAVIWGDLWTYRIPLNRDLAAALVDKVEEFWGYVQRREMPPITEANASAASEFLTTYHRHQKDDGMLGLTAEQDQGLRVWALEYDAAKGDEKAAKERKKAAKAHLLAVIGASAGIRGDGWKTTWKQSKGTDKTDWEALARSMDPPEDMIAQFTHTKPGSRRFLCSPPKPEEIENGS